MYWLDFYPSSPGRLNPAMQASDQLRYQSLTQNLDFHYQALADSIAQHAEQRRVEIDKEKMEKESTTVASWKFNLLQVLWLFHSFKNYWREAWMSCQLCMFRVVSLISYPFVHCGSLGYEAKCGVRAVCVHLGYSIRYSLQPTKKDMPLCSCHPVLVYWSIFGLVGVSHVRGFVQLALLLIVIKKTFHIIWC